MGQIDNSMGKVELETGLSVQSSLREVQVTSEEFKIRLTEVLKYVLGAMYVHCSFHEFYLDDQVANKTMKMIEVILYTRDHNIYSWSAPLRAVFEYPNIVEIASLAIFKKNLLRVQLIGV